MRKQNTAAVAEKGKTPEAASFEGAPLPARNDPDVVRWQRDFKASFLAAHNVAVVGQHTVTFTLPPGETLMRFIKEGGELCGLFLDQPPLSERAFSRWEYRESFHEVKQVPHSITLDAAPKDGANISFADARIAFKNGGRTIASTAEVVAGHVACLLATSLLGFTNRIRRLEAQDKSKRDVRDFFGEFNTTRSFFTSPTFRTSEHTITYNSLVGLDIGDYDRRNAHPLVSVIERLEK